jgi:hypothetical protein
MGDPVGNIRLAVRGVVYVYYMQSYPYCSLHLLNSPYCDCRGTEDVALLFLNR